jgi:GDP-mannose 6-dehydrogenase
VVALLEQLIGKGRNVRVFDPQILPDRIYGSNQRYLLAAIPHIGRLFDSSLDQMLAWADHLVVAQKPSPEYARLIAASGLPTTDLVSTVPTPLPVSESASGA